VKPGRMLALVAALLGAAACAEVPVRPIMSRDQWRALHASHTAHLIELAKTHPNALPRPREAFPTEAPSYSLPDFRIDLQRRAQAADAY